MSDTISVIIDLCDQFAVTGTRLTHIMHKATDIERLGKLALLSFN